VIRQNRIFRGHNTDIDELSECM